MATKRKRYKSALSYRLREIPIKQIKIWKDAQARKLDREGISELAKSIKSEGLQNPPLVQKEGRDTFLLMAGQRRLAALKKLGAKKVPVLVVTKDTQFDLDNAKAASVIENLHRRDMDAKEMAASCVYLAEKMGKSKAAKALGIMPKTLRQHLGFAAVPDAIKQMVPKTISRTDAIRICKVIPGNISHAKDIANKISKYDGPAKKRYLDALEHLGANAEHSEIIKLANRFRAKQNISMKLSKRQAKGLAKIASDTEAEPNELARKIVLDYLKRRGY